MLLLVSSAAADDTDSFGMVRGSASATLRADPSYSSASVAFCTPGEWVSLLSEQGNWIQVSTEDGTIGYLPGNAIQKTNTEIRLTGIVSGMDDGTILNLRERPSYRARVIGIYSNGTPCTILAHENGWYEVQVDGLTGYFREEYVTEENLPWSDSVATLKTPNGKGTLLRTGPGLNYVGMRRVPEGSYLMLLNEGAVWSRVSLRGAVGFVQTASLAHGILQPQKETDGAQIERGYGIVSNPKTTQVLNLREYPDTGSRSLAQYANGAKVWITEQGMEWCAVETLSGQHGYMMTSYLRLVNLPQVPLKHVSHPDETYANLRDLPSVTLGTVLAEVSHGSEVTVLIPGEIWYKVSYQGQIGYISAEFLK